MTILTFPSPELPSVSPSVSLTNSTTEPSTPAMDVRSVIQRLREEPELRAKLMLLGSPDDTVKDAATESVVGLLAQLRAIVTRNVCRMRAEGAWPEQVLVQVKTWLREAMTAERWNEPRILEALNARVVDWSIAAYYDR